ncbi:hypothetical protein [Desulfovibrio oxyclinae]|uniref:hypothetical protein n=1 Tax=Desulfovibrio oxyclinae TaxID=63560 RepID=UPI00036AA339|nr:hypothetical protein [Desulfovibrio oxyclinae]
MEAHKESCGYCEHLTTECDGNYPELAVSWPACAKVERYQYLKSFPFKKKMNCFSPAMSKEDEAEWCRKRVEEEEASRPDRCDDCAHYDSGFNWRLMKQDRTPSCQYGTPPEVCSKFYNTAWVDAVCKEVRLSAGR